MPISAPTGITWRTRHEKARDGRSMRCPSTREAGPEPNNGFVRAAGCPGVGRSTRASSSSMRRSRASAILDVASGSRRDVLSDPKRTLWQPEFSPDDRWVAFEAVSGSSSRLYVVAADALRRSPPPETWIAISDGETWDDKPRWSPDGNLLYFISERDGFRCAMGAAARPADETPLRCAGRGQTFSQQPSVAEERRLRFARDVDYPRRTFSECGGAYRGYLGSGDP